VGTRRSTIWIHDANGERPVSSEGYALSPQLSRSGTRVFYLEARDLMLTAVGWQPASAELRSVDLRSGKSDIVLPGLAVTDYDISSDEKEVAYTAKDADGESTIWLAALNHDSPPRVIARAGDQVSFGAGELIFRSLSENNVLVRIKKDGTGRERLTSAPVLDKFGVSPDGEWAIVYSPATGDSALAGTLAVPIHGGAPRKICGIGDCRATWSADGHFLFVSNYLRSSRSTFSLDEVKTLAIPLLQGKPLPDLTGFDPLRTQLPGSHVLDHEVLSSGPGPTTYVFTKTDLQRNLFRIPLH
jgi:hypothetical protein